MRLIAASSIRWKSSKCCEFLPNRDNRRSIHSERIDCCAPDSCSPTNSPATGEGEVFGPRIKSWVEQSHPLAGSVIDRLDTGRFPE